MWELLADPYHLPRWWPRCARVEDVHDAEGGSEPRWTTVLQTAGGSVVRADYRRVSAESPTALVWEQEIEGTPFDRILSEARIEFALGAADGSTRLEITARQKVRGFFTRFGTLMLRRGTARNLDEALDGIERALESGAEEDAGRDPLAPGREGEEASGT